MMNVVDGACKKFSVTDSLPLRGKRSSTKNFSA